MALVEVSRKELPQALFLHLCSTSCTLPTQRSKSRRTAAFCSSMSTLWKLLPSMGKEPRGAASPSLTLSSLTNTLRAASVENSVLQSRQVFFLCCAKGSIHPALLLPFTGPLYLEIPSMFHQTNTAYHFHVNVAFQQMVGWKKKTAFRCRSQVEAKEAT